jgi:hypothetical protein
MARVTTKGKCAYCQQSFDKRGMSRHLAVCEKRQEALQNPSRNGNSKVRTAKVFHLQVEGGPDSQYWMHIEIPGDVSLKVLDTFLRDIWLECCGHLSAYRIAGQTYSIYAQSDWGERNMNHKLEQVLSPGLSFTHEYDFGTTTELALKVVAEREGQVQGRSVVVMARNEPPVIPCGICDNLATYVCTQCGWDPDDTPWVCDEHAPEHPCGDEMLLPVVNSPRVGVCGYTGPLRGWG